MVIVLHHWAEEALVPFGMLHLNNNDNNNNNINIYVIQKVITLLVNCLHVKSILVAIRSQEKLDQNLRIKQ